MIDRRDFAVALALALGAAGWACDVRAQSTGGDPFGSIQWPDLKKEFFGNARTTFDERVLVKGPGFAEDPMNVPVSFSAPGLEGVEAVVVIVDRNPIRKVLEFFPGQAAPSLGFRFKLEQASPVRVAMRTKDGVWHLGGTLVDSAGGGCTVPGGSRADNTWSQTLGQVSARQFPGSPALGQSGTRLRLRVMHPMDTGLANGIPAFYLNRLALRDAQGRELLRMNTFEPVSENPVFSFDFTERLAPGVRVVASDNNGNRIDRRLD